MSPIKQHPLSAIFPALSDDELTALADDIKANGLHSPITLYDGQILDGWHRYRACGMAGIVAQTVDYTGNDPAGFVKSANWHRRHLSASQRALAEVQLSEWLPAGNPLFTHRDPTTPPNGGVRKSSSDMASEARVGTRTIERAKRVERSGSDELKTAVKEGEISVDKAAKIANLPKAKQAAAMKEKPAKKPTPAKTEATEDELYEMAKTLEAASDQIEKLEALVESLQKDDLAKEVAAWSLKFDKLEGRLQQEITTKNEAIKQAKYCSGMLAKIRKALNVEQNSEILEAISDLRK